MKITIVIDTDADPSTVLDMAVGYALELSEDIRDHGYKAVYDENDVIVSD